MKREPETDSDSEEEKVFNLFRTKTEEPQAKRHRSEKYQIFKQAEEALRAAERKPKKERKPYYQGQLYDNIPEVDDQ